MSFRIDFLFHPLDDGDKARIRVKSGKRIIVIEPNLPVEIQIGIDGRLKHDERATGIAFDGERLRLN